MSHSSIYEGYTFEETENRQYFYKREEEYFDEVLHKKRLEHEQKTREITSEALARILVNSRRLQVKMADKVAKQIAAQATKNALMKSLTAHLEASATISTPVDAQLAGQATAHNEQLMYG